MLIFFGNLTETSSEDIKIFPVKYCDNAISKLVVDKNLFMYVKFNSASVH